MAMKLYDSDSIQAIATAIRAKDEDVTLMKVDDMPARIANLNIGGNGLTYETGIFIPSNGIAHPTINFQNNHDKRPFHVIITSQESQPQGANEVLFWLITSWYDAFNSSYHLAGGSTNYYGRIQYAFSASSGNSQTAGGVYISSLTGDSSNTSMPFSLTESYFAPYAGSTARYFKYNYHYAWTAVWA